MLGKAKRFFDKHRDRLALARPYEDHEGEHPAWMKLFKAPPFVTSEFNISLGAKGAGGSTLRVGVIADPHVGSHPGDIERLKQAVDAINALTPDLVVLPGDFMNMTPIGWGRVPPERIAEIFGGLIQERRYAVLGNHDRDFGAGRVHNALESAGIEVLENRAVDIAIGNRRLRLIGVEDANTGDPDLSLMTHERSADLSLIITHDPALFAHAPAGDVLMICGHTHGGQIVLPFLGPVVNASRAPLRWTYGHINEGGRHLVVSAGFGTSGLPIRWNRPPEIALLTIELGVSGDGS
ncbi:MAG: metallophosphoesterase [Alphaproteobacteria bacterium]